MLKRLVPGLILACSLISVGFAQSTSDPLAIDAKHQKDIDGDKEQGRKLVETVEKNEKMSKNEDMQKRVQRVGGEMAALANKTHLATLWGDKRFSKFDYDFKVLEGKDVNAFSLPGGHIYVYEGLVNFIQSDDELAAVLGHEVSHAALRHVATLQRDAAKHQAIEIPLIIASILAGGKGQTPLTGISLYNQAVFSGWSINAEKAADYGGFQLMKESPYNPTACLTVVERLSAMERGNPQLNMDWGIFRTHPPSEERVEAILGDIKTANVPIQRSAVTTSFSVSLKKTDTGVDALFGDKLLYTFVGDDAQTRATSAQKRLNSFFDTVPPLYDVKVNGDKVVGNTSLLIDIKLSDAEHAKTSVSQLANKTVSSIQGALYSLAYQVWQPSLEGK
jgi:predicted Zn-dependent protease